MKISKKHSIRLPNGPLKSLTQIGPNMTVVEHGNVIVLYSYETPVALLAPGGGYMTEKKWSTTTSKHIGKFFAAYGYDKRGAAKIPQEDIEAFARAGKAKGVAGMTGAEFVEQHFPHRDNRPRRTRRRMGLIKDMRFFREHGGGVVGEGSRGGLDLARAEREAERRGWHVEWVPDDDADWSWLDQPGFEKEKARDHEVYGAVLKDRHGNVLASLWGIFDPDSKYQRVVEAELASEALSGL